MRVVLLAFTALLLAPTATAATCSHLQNCSDVALAILDDGSRTAVKLGFATFRAAMEATDPAFMDARSLWNETSDRAFAEWTAAHHTTFEESTRAIHGVYGAAPFLPREARQAVCDVWSPRCDPDATAPLLP